MSQRGFQARTYNLPTELQTPQGSIVTSTLLGLAQGLGTAYQRYQQNPYVAGAGGISALLGGLSGLATGAQQRFTANEANRKASVDYENDLSALSAQTGIGVDELRATKIPLKLDPTRAGFYQNQTQATAYENALRDLNLQNPERYSKNPELAKFIIGQAATAMQNQPNLEQVQQLTDSQGLPTGNLAQVSQVLAPNNGTFKSIELEEDPANAPQQPLSAGVSTTPKTISLSTLFSQPTVPAATQLGAIIGGANVRINQQNTNIRGADAASRIKFREIQANKVTNMYQALTSSNPRIRAAGEAQLAAISQRGRGGGSLSAQASFLKGLSEAALMARTPAGAAAFQLYLQQAPSFGIDPDALEGFLSDDQTDSAVPSGVSATPANSFIDRLNNPGKGF